ncbi:MAG: hypothetical protein ABSF83_15475, partial [Nitrososphaerales archaeon]
MAVGRFQVMALLQAARAYSLGLPLESARSWGLNRAIFYAAAKRGFRGAGAGAGVGHRQTEAKEGEAEGYRLGDDLAFIDAKMSAEGRPIFAFGGDPQTEEAFARQVESRFQGSFKAAWEQALDFVRRFPKETLESQSLFYSDVYRPKRDELAEEWTVMSEGGVKAEGPRVALKAPRSARVAAPAPSRDAESARRTRDRR